MDAPTTEELTPELVGDFIRKESSRRRTELRQSILAASETNPDQYAEATRLGRTVDMPPDFVAADMDTYRNDMKLDDQTAEKIVSLYPSYEAWLSQPDNARMAHDDVHMGVRVLDFMRAFPSGVLQATGQGIEGLGNLSLSASQVLGDMSQKNKMMAMDSNMQMLRLYTSLFGMAAPTIGGGISDVGEFVGPPEERQNTATNISSGVGQVGAQILAYVYTGGTGTLAMMAGQGAQQQTERLDAAGVEDPALRLAAQTLGAGATAVTERIQLGALLKGVPGLDKVMGQLPKALQKKWASRVIDVGAAGGAEAAQETIEGFLQDTIEYAAYNPDVEFLKGMKQQAAEAGAVGAISRALILGISGARGGTRAIQNEEGSASAQELARQNVEQIRSSKLQSRDPEKMREVLKAGNTEGKTVTLDGSVVQQFYQSGIDPEEFFNLAPAAREQFEQADTAGTDVTIPLDEFLHAVASAPDSSYDFITDFMKVDPDIDPALQGWDLKDPEEMNAFIQQAMRQAQEEYGARFEQVQETELSEMIERQIRDNLMNTEMMGEKVRSAETAAAEAALVAQYIRTRLSKGGDAAQRVFRDRMLGQVFQVRGFKPELPRPTGTGSAYYDKLRKKVKAKESAQKRSDAKPKQGGLFGIGKKTKARATPTPLINALIARGGIQRGSPIAAELEAAGITPKAYPRLYARGKLRDIDNIPLDELEGDLGTTGVFTNDESLNGYVDRDELISRLRDETFGDYIRTDEQLQQEAIDEQEQQLLDVLSQEGVDITTATAAEIDAALDNALTRERLEYETAQPGSYYQSERGVTQFSDAGQTIVKLFKDADESTLVHEMGHIFLDLDAMIAAQEDAPENFKQEWQDTLAWLGVENYADVKTEHHEKFARGFEAYLYRGEAPSAAVKGVFDRFKLWMTNLYRTIKQLGFTDISPEMKQVFDRLLATNDEIEAMRSNPTFAPDEATLEMLNEQQRQDYLKRKDAAIQEAKNKLFRKAIRQARRQKTEWWKEESGKVQAEVEAELQNQPVYQVIQFLQTGQDFKGNPLGENMESFKLNESAVIDAFGGDKAVAREELKYLPRGVRTRDGGIDPRIIADMFGFKSAQDMLRQMQSVTPYKQALARQTEDRMIERHGDMLNDGTIEQEALAMVMAEDTKAAQVELQALSERTGAAYPSDGDFAKAAEIALGNLSVDHAVKPDKYYRAAIKAAREYGKALAQKDYEAAADAKRREILNKHLHRLAKSAREETDKALDRFKKLEKKPPKGNARAVKIDPDYHEKIWAILDKYNLQPRMTDAKRLRIELKAINEWMQAKEQDEDAALMMPPELLAADDKTHYRDLTMNEFRALRDLVVNLETQGRNKRKYIMEGQQRELEELVAEMVATAEQNNAPRDVSLSERRAGRKLSKKFGNIINGIDAVNTKASQMLVMLDGGDNLGIWTRAIYEPLQRAEIARNIRQRSEFERFRDILQSYYGDEANGFLDREVVGGIEPVRFEEMLSIALHQGTEDNRQKLIDGYQEARGWSQEYVDTILENMRAKDWDFVQEVWDYMDSFWSETSAVEKSRFGYAPEKIEAMPFEVVTADGQVKQMRGGYMRIMYDSNQDVMAANDELSQTFKELQIGKNARAATRRGSQIERVSGVRRPMRLDLDVVTEHISEQVGIIHMSETVENISKVLRKKEVQETVQSILGRDGKEMLDLWLKDVAVGGAMSGGAINKGLRMIRTNYTIGRLGLRPVTAVLQFSGLSHTVADYGAKQTAKGLAKMFSRGNPYTVAKEVAEKSVFMQERRFTLNRDIAQALDEYSSTAQNVRQKVSALMLYPIQKAQELVDTATWLAAYDKATQEGMDDADAIRSADIAVSRLQASGLVSDLAAIERGTLNTSTQRQETVKALTMFFSYFNAKYNLLKNKNTQFRNKQISGVDLAMSYVMALLVEGAISAAIMGQIDWDKDDDEELSAKEIAFGITGMTLFNAASTVPFVRTISSGAQGFSGETAAMGQLSGLGEFAGRLAGAGESLIDGEEGKPINYYSLTRNAVDAINVFYPVPASTINQFIRGMERQEKTGEATPMDYLIYREDRF